MNPPVKGKHVIARGVPRTAVAAPDLRAGSAPADSLVSRTALQAISAELATLQQDTDYQWFLSHSPSTNFGELRLGVEETIDRCLVLSPDEPTVSEIWLRLNGLRALCVGTLDKFGPFIERAGNAL